jgi:hypothetical protein
MTQLSFALIVQGTEQSVADIPDIAKTPIIADAVVIPDTQAIPNLLGVAENSTAAPMPVASEAVAMPDTQGISEAYATPDIQQIIDVATIAETAAIAECQPMAAARAQTIADAQVVVANWVGLPAKRRQKLLTALSTAARVLGPTQPKQSAAAAIQVDCSTLSQLLQALAATFGLSAGRVTSLISEPRAVLRHLGLHDPDYRGTVLNSPVMQSCELALPTHTRHALVDFLRWVDREQIPPEAVDTGTLVAFLQCTLCADPAERASDRQGLELGLPAHP